MTGPHTPKFIASGDFSRQPYIVLEWIEGDTLLDDAALAASEAAEIGVGVARALADLYRQNVIHLDIKPSNVMRRPGGLPTPIAFARENHVDQMVIGAVSPGGARWVRSRRESPPKRPARSRWRVRPVRLASRGPAKRARPSRIQDSASRFCAGIDARRYRR